MQRRPEKIKSNRWLDRTENQSYIVIVLRIGGYVSVGRGRDGYKHPAPAFLCSEMNPPTRRNILVGGFFIYAFPVERK